MGADWDQLYEIATGQAGHFTSAQAAGAGFSTALLDHHLRRGRIERVHRAIYRLVRWPMGEHDDLVVVWLWSGQEGVFSHETALALHDLSDALPAKKHLTVPVRWERRRVRVPAGVILHYAEVGEGDRRWVGCVPVTSPTRTVLDCAADRVPHGLVLQALEDARERGLISEATAVTVLERMDAERAEQ